MGLALAFGPRCANGHATRLTVGHAGRVRKRKIKGLDDPEGRVSGSVIPGTSVRSHIVLLIA
ncbi:hypothetical protein BJP36_40910 [Moorena producens JHB]|uniref:Uncharacterized protein n=1 Tax=Moorena producens (strain JHB) TaxID=1454205 RepID=A0A9Q9UVE3_MOOP1|nr:hypothetical protein [Moorena producens]WAN68731.1 hypothetical protein BJP36_40910 [Moorena producens JHB]